MPRPITSQAAVNSGSDGARARPACPSASSTALAASTGRPPRRAIARPTAGETAAAVSRPSDRPPTTPGSDHPVSVAIGPASTAGR